MKTKPLKILGISGSTKSTSTSLSLLEMIKKKYENRINLHIYNSIDTLPHFNPELEESLPASVVELRNLIKESDGVIFCTPEYVFSLPGSLKNMIEWNVSTVLFSNKPVAIIVAAASGKKAFESLDLILTTIESSLPDESKLLIQGAKGKIEKDGHINDHETINKIDKVVESLIKTTQDLHRKPSKY